MTLPPSASHLQAGPLEGRKEGETRGWVSTVGGHLKGKGEQAVILRCLQEADVDAW